MRTDVTTSGMSRTESPEMREGRREGKNEGCLVNIAEYRLPPRTIKRDVCSFKVVDFITVDSKDRPHGL